MDTPKTTKAPNWGRIQEMMIATKLRPGDRVMIYQDPFTRLKLEGKARLAEFIRINPGVPYSEDWYVIFDGEHEKYPRTIA